MRLSVAAVCLCCCLIGFSAADDAHASIRKETNIPAEGLGPALNALAKDRNFQIVYVTEEIADVRTGGAVGEFTTDEALKRLLTGTGLTYQYLDDKTVTIRSARTSHERSGRGSIAASSGSSDDANPKEGKKSSSDGFRTAQVGQGTSTHSGPLGESDATSAGKNALEEIVVKGYKYLNIDTSGTTNLPLPIEKVPQSISLVSNDFIMAADLKTLGAIAEYTPGAINVGNPANTNTVIKLRGFIPGRAVDGINVIGTTYEPDFAIYDRLEIVKGPSSVVYGVSSPGGVVNFVTKSATRQTIDYLYAQYGSWNSYRLEGQIAGALDAEGHVRAIGVAVQDQGDSFIHELNHKKTTLYAGVDFDLSDSIKAYLHGGYERFERTYFDGIPTEADGSPAPLPRSFFIGTKNAGTTSWVWHAESDLTWHATDMLEFSVKGNFERANQDGSQVYSYGLTATGDIGLTANTLPVWFERNYGIGASSIYRFDDLGLKNSFVSLAALYQDSTNDNNSPLRGNGVANIFNGEASISQAFDSLLAGPPVPNDVLINAKALTVSGQSVFQLIDPLTLLLGVSYSKPDVTAISNGVLQSAGSHSQISYRAGLTYEFLPRTNAYVSYSQSFNPQPHLTIDLKILPPLTGEQYEGGLKYRSENGRLLLTGAMFQIREKNLQAYDQSKNGIDFYRAVGQITHKGLEFQSLGQITQGWQVNAGYAYLDPEVNKDTNPAAVGQTELFLPKQTASLYTSYTLQSAIVRGLSFGGGVRYVSAQRTSYDGSTRDLPAYTVADASLGYTVDKWLVQLNAHNIFDKHYFINNYQTLFYGNVWGDPANFALSVRRTF